jgi:hypothetical protein
MVCPLLPGVGSTAITAAIIPTLAMEDTARHYRTQEMPILPQLSLYSGRVQTLADIT